MIQTRWIRRAAIGGALVLPLLTAGCGLFSKETSAIDPPQGEVSDEANVGDGNAPTTSTDMGAGTDTSTDTGAAAQGEQTNLTVYLEDASGYLAPVSIGTTLAANEPAGKRALELMIDGGAYASELPADFRALLPKGTQINSFKIDEQKLAQVDFSEAFTSYNAQDERSIVEAIAWTLTASPDIQGVEISVDGQKLPEMPQDSFPLDEPLTRSVGINIETGEGVSYSQSTPVTLYFSSQTASNEQYYVPVTRLIARTDKPAEAALEQLIAGPLNGDQLTAVITPDFKVTEVATEGDTVTVDLQDDAYVPGQAIPQELLQAVVLSVTENTGAAKVQIRVNGETNVVDENNNSYGEPVSRPHHVNALKS